MTVPTKELLPAIDKCIELLHKPTSLSLLQRAVIADVLKQSKLKIKELVV